MHAFFLSIDFLKIKIFEKSKSSDPDQAQHFVKPDLGPTFCKSCQQTTLVGEELRVKHNKISF